MNGRKLVEMTTSTLLKRTSSPCSSAVMSKYLQLRYGSGGHGGGGASELEEGETRPWNYLWQPSPYPETKEEREAAARKYGMIPEDYEPYDPTDWGLGDYPKLEKSSQDSRSGQIDWDYMADRRNFGEPMMRDYDASQATRFDDTTKLPRSQAQLWAGFLAWVGGFALLFYIGSHFKRHPGVTAEQYPGKGKTHYTFDIE